MVTIASIPCIIRLLKLVGHEEKMRAPNSVLNGDVSFHVIIAPVHYLRDFFAASLCLVTLPLHFILNQFCTQLHIIILGENTHAV